MTESPARHDAGTPYRAPTLVPPTVPGVTWSIRRVLVLPAVWAAVLATREITRDAPRGALNLPAVHVTLDDPCARRGGEFGPVTAITVWQQGSGPAGRGATVHPTGRWTRREAFPSSQFTPPDQHRAGCVDALRVAPLFAAFADELAAPSTARGARPDETCVTGYVTAAGETVTTPRDRCVAPQLAAAILAAVPGDGRVEPPSPRACRASDCEIAYTVGVTPHPHGGGSQMTLSLRRDGVFVCDDGGAHDAVVGRLAPAATVYGWLLGDVTRRAVDREAREYMQPYERVDLRDGTGAPVFSTDVAPVARRWRALAAMLPDGCMPAATVR